MRAPAPPPEVRRARLAVAVTFLVHAAVFATWAPRIPSIKQALHLDNGALGIALGGLAVGLLVGTRLTGRMERAGRTGLAMRILVPVQAVALVGPAFATDLVTLTAALAVLGLIGGMLDVAMNAHAVAVERLYGRPIMSGFHGLWSLGSMAGSAIAALVAREGVDVRVHFIVAGVVCAVASAPFLARLLRPEQEAAVTGHHVEVPGGRRPPVRVVVVVMMAAMGFGSFLGEGAIADWSAVYLNESLGASVGLAALGLSVFSGAMTASRLIADRVGAKYGPVVVARAGAALGALGYVIFLLAPGPAVALVGFAVAGFGIGPAVPVVFSAAGNTGTKNRVSVLGPVVSAGYLGAVLGPVAIGAVAHRVGLEWALVIPLAFVALIFVAAGLLRGAAGGKSDGEEDGKQGGERAGTRTGGETAARAHGPANIDG
ncbi:Sugar phosphate permease [Actinopolymorpha cephalotaxi]|uniref:MFS family permease n=1 Tax=Actinopolymorpha cephalotaxi TaxID=504797 RepID=A0A1I2KE14_9ACTN|nr:MFS transporter [Actinopolymorpha cephalotaxi]NYH84425.1 MFS family permease [Actinopolymorpha cephalotaxi]SFF64539.1 Sugar phosphate permease [Actinopolymorpha cephalotaxi]